MLQQSLSNMKTLKPAIRPVSANEIEHTLMLLEFLVGKLRF
jgi:hypothetical protein